ncbi:hypothetical protein BX666DRAFT_1929071 [Dichotomocladium elegans]|nr:hypothetical protein BX666DRAFT_1929071 [Dichotomocladium elegans]
MCQWARKGEARLQKCPPHLWQEQSTGLGGNIRWQSASNVICILYVSIYTYKIHITQGESYLKLLSRALCIAWGFSAQRWANVLMPLPCHPAEYGKF